MSRRVRLSVAKVVIEDAGDVATTEFVIPDNSTVVGVEIRQFPTIPIGDGGVDLHLQVSIVTDLGPSN